MARKIVCDGCGREITEQELYNQVFRTPQGYSIPEGLKDLPFSGVNDGYPHSSDNKNYIQRSMELCRKCHHHIIESITSTIQTIREGN